MLRGQIDDYFYQTDQPRNDRYLVQTRSQVRSSGIKLPEIHGANKGLDPHVRPGKQRSLPSLSIQIANKGLPTHPIPKPRIGQGRARLRRKDKNTSTTIFTPSVTCSANNTACSESSNAIA